MGVHLSDAASATEVAQSQVVSRVNEMIDGVIEPAVTALEDTYAFLSTEAAISATPAVRRDVHQAAIDLAVAQRFRSITARVDGLQQRIRDEVAAIRRECADPLSVMDFPAQFAFWMAEIRSQRIGRESMVFTATARVDFSAEYVRSHEEFLTKLLVEFVQQWELAAYQDYVAEGEAPDEAFAKSRVITRPSWEALREWGSVRLSVEDALTMVAAGVTLGLWEAWPDPSQVRQFPEVDEQYMPFLIPTEALLGVSAA